MAVVANFDPGTPSIARVYDYLLNGKDNFAADREVAERLLAVAPLTVEVTRENRQFLARAVTWAARQGITQFIDLGCGMPTAPNTHQTARAIAAGARVAYVDNDAVVLSHLRALAVKGDAADQGFGAYSSGAARVYNHSVPEFASFFGALELVPPGVVDAREWRPDWEQAVHLPPRDGQVIVGVARVG
jgi:hypothetical protein